LADAIDCVSALGQYCGGRQRYLPTGERLLLALRDRRIWKEWRGNNEAEMLARYAITQRRLQQILAEQRAIHTRKFQGNLFE
jgi:Mor family transcriptional regulator